VSTERGERDSSITLAVYSGLCLKAFRPLQWLAEPSMEIDNGCASLPARTIRCRAERVRRFCAVRAPGPRLLWSHKSYWCSNKIPDREARKQRRRGGGGQ